MIGKTLAIGALGTMTVRFPRLAQLAPGPRVARATTFVMHGTQPFSPPAEGEGGWLEDTS